MSEDNSIRKEQVIAYLKEHPEFFKDQDDLLTTLRIPHQTGGAISLLERQLEIHRERNLELRQRLSRLIDNARHNDVLFDRTKKLMLAILKAENLSELVQLVEHNLKKDFEIDFAKIQIFAVPNSDSKHNLNLFTDEELQTRIKRVFKGKQAICGEFTDAEWVLLLPEHHEAVQSGAAVFLRNERNLGILAIGSQDKNKFRSSMDTLFLNFIGDVLNSIIPNHVEQFVEETG